jgi:hypothetical protein
MVEKRAGLLSWPMEEGRKEVKKGQHQAKSEVNLIQQ